MESQRCGRIAPMIAPRIFAMEGCRLFRKDNMRGLGRGVLPS